ncbi:serine hydrolase domain-containing protein [Shimia sp. MIT1388]|uniref:serine hydrolase domain-containing protein n=1 Tax=Shimia sp. MIT1388 TaxID=3096992 RepID=UPI003999D181
MIGTALPQDRGFDTNRLAQLSGWMDQLVTDRKYAGCGALIARDGDVVFDHATGLRSIAAGTPFERDTVARIYSMTKPVTTVALMMLVERGLVHLDAPVSNFIPAFKDCHALVPGASTMDQVEPCATPTLHQLATHTSGLSYPFNPGLLAKQMDAQDLMFKANQGPLSDMADQVAALPLAFQPGTRWEYSVSIDILGRVIEVITGQSLAEFLESEILDPLGMSETGFSVIPGTEDRFADLYTPLEGDAMALNQAKIGADTLRLVDTTDGSPFLNASMHSGGGGLVGTMDDYLRFAEMLRRGGALGDVRLLSPRTVRFMTSNHLPGDIASMGPMSFAEQPMDGMGFGLGGAVVLDPARARCPGSVGDFSWGGMASTFFWIDPVEKLSVVFFTQLSPSSSYPTRPQLKALVHAALTS